MSAKIIKGSKEKFSIFLKDEDGNAFNLTPYFTGPGDIAVCIPSGTPIILELNGGAGGITVPIPTNGEIKGELTSAQSGSMEEQTFDIDVILTETTDVANPTIIKISSALKVEARAC